MLFHHAQNPILANQTNNNLPPRTPRPPVFTILPAWVCTYKLTLNPEPSAVSFAGLGYLALYLGGKSGTFTGRYRLPTYLPFLLPLIGAAAVGISRLRDYWHHWQDVTVGSLLGEPGSNLGYRTLMTFFRHQASPEMSASFVSLQAIFQTGALLEVCRDSRSAFLHNTWCHTALRYM